MASPPPSEGIDPHSEHTPGVLSITTMTSGGMQVHQSWQMCGCTLDDLREALGAPDHELMATGEQAQAAGRAIDAIPGITHFMP
ncbi:hypothetical protein AB0F88_16985 [Streptosporangium sp. NPDC023963]|uniref:hypothetical protein n=1 Tax=Streptosporangium sp. NPDC023963 TaxID=3155608 RepID=UPI0034355A79